MHGVSLTALFWHGAAAKQKQGGWAGRASLAPWQAPLQSIPPFGGRSCLVSEELVCRDGITHGLERQNDCRKKRRQCGWGGVLRGWEGGGGATGRPTAGRARSGQWQELLGGQRPGVVAPARRQGAAAGGRNRRAALASVYKQARQAAQKARRPGGREHPAVRCYRTAVPPAPPPKQAPKQEKRPPPLPRFSPCRRVAPELAGAPLVAGGTPRLGGGLSNGGPEPSSHRHIRSAQVRHGKGPAQREGEAAGKAGCQRSRGRGERQAATGAAAAGVGGGLGWVAGLVAAGAGSRRGQPARSPVPASP